MLRGVFYGIHILNLNISTFFFLFSLCFQNLQNYHLWLKVIFLIYNVKNFPLDIETQSLVQNIPLNRFKFFSYIPTLTTLKIASYCIFVAIQVAPTLLHNTSPECSEVKNKQKAPGKHIGCLKQNLVSSALKNNSSCA